jgi:hypothetical protein
MPAPRNEREALERERNELLGLIEALRFDRDAATPGDTQDVREQAQSQLGRAESRLAELQERLTALLGEAEQAPEPPSMEPGENHLPP